MRLRTQIGQAVKQSLIASLWLAFGVLNPPSAAHSETDDSPGAVQNQQMGPEDLKIIIGFGFDFPDVLFDLHQFKCKSLKNVVFSGDPMPVHWYGPEHLHLITQSHQALGSNEDADANWMG